jgi:hypothetical protein
MQGWNVSREVAVVPIDTSLVDPKFVAHWIGSAASQRWLKCVERGVAYIGIPSRLSLYRQVTLMWKWYKKKFKLPPALAKI